MTAVSNDFLIVAWSQLKDSFGNPCVLQVLLHQACNPNSCTGQATPSKSSQDGFIVLPVAQCQLVPGPLDAAKEKQALIMNKWIDFYPISTDNLRKYSIFIARLSALCEMGYTVCIWANRRISLSVCWHNFNIKYIACGVCCHLEYTLILGRFPVQSDLWANKQLYWSIWGLKALLYGLSNGQRLNSFSRLGKDHLHIWEKPTLTFGKRWWDTNSGLWCQSQTLFWIHPLQPPL